MRTRVASRLAGRSVLKERHGPFRKYPAMSFTTRITTLLGIRYPIVQAGMSWASSNAALPLAVSQAGALGVIAAGPMYPDALRAAIRTVKEMTDRPFAVNVPLYNQRAATFLDIVLEERVPILIASQGGPKQHLARFKDHGVTWLHVTASPEHAAKAEAAGVDAVIAVGSEAGGHPPPDEVGTLVVVRAVVKAVSIPVIAGGGVADGAGIAALFCLGAEGVQLGTRFLMTPESNLHQAYRDRTLAAGIGDTTLIGRGKLPMRMLKNDFTREFEAAERAGASDDRLKTFSADHTLKMAAFDGDVERGKVEVGQSAGLIDEIVPAAEVVRRLVSEFEAAIERMARFRQHVGAD
jgi:enoyl-[acyl-carrier protein] reductase II